MTFVLETVFSMGSLLFVAGLQQVRSRPFARRWFLKFLRLAISGVSAMQGAPLWFELLKELIGLRAPASSTSAPPSK